MVERVLDKGVDGLEARVLDGAVRLEPEPERSPRRCNHRREIAAAIFAYKISSVSNKTKRHFVFSLE